MGGSGSAVAAPPQPGYRAAESGIGQEIGIRIGPGNVNDSYFAGVTRKNTEQLGIDAQLNNTSQRQGTVAGQPNPNRTRPVSSGNDAYRKPKPYTISSIVVYHQGDYLS
jgi:hypothetical protein